MRRGKCSVLLLFRFCFSVLCEIQMLPSAENVVSLFSRRGCHALVLSLRREEVGTPVSECEGGCKKKKGTC